MTDAVQLRKNAEGRMSGLRTARYSWWLHWRELADYILPRRYRWLVTPNEAQRGSPLNARILDSTGTVAVRRLAAGMMSGITSPTRPWFKLKVDGFDDDANEDVKLWVAEVERRMMRVFQESNFYTSMAVLYFDLVVFGTGVMIEYEDFEDVIRFYNPCAGEYYLANSSRMNANVLAREFTLTYAQMAQQFGKENCSEAVRRALDNEGGTGASMEAVICHLIEPNTDNHSDVKSAPFREIYWERGAQGTDILAQKLFHEFPAMCPRWDLSGNDAYGRSPAMDALPDVKQLQQETKRKAQGIDKMVNPPMLADMQLKNQPASVIPGGVTFVTNLRDNPGMKTVYAVTPPIQEMMLDIKEIQTRIGEILFNDLFLMISQLQTVRTATEIDARREEKLIMLGPVLERFYNEALDPVVTRTFNIMNRAGLFNSIEGGTPQAIQGRNIQISYISMLSEAQKASAAGGIERILQLVGNLAAVDQTAVDNINVDDTINIYSDLMGNDPRVIATPDQVAQKRQSRADQIKAQQAAQTGTAAVQGAQTLSQTNVGGGQNALQAMLGNG